MASKAIFRFGDSIFDASNNHYNPNCTVQADFSRPTGRFTNGGTVADFIAEFLGIPLQKPYMEIMNGTEKKFPANGINFASAGSGLLSATNNLSVSKFHLFLLIILSTWIPAA